MSPVFIAIWLVIGAIAGWLASLIVKAGSLGLIGDVIVGLVGAAIAGYLLPNVGVHIGTGFVSEVINAVIGAVNVGRDKDSDRRQRKAIEAFARRVGFEIVSEHYDAAVSGADAIEGRPGFAALLEHIDSNHVRVVLVEDQARFARDLKVYVLGLAHLRARDVRLITADGHDLTSDKDEMTEAMLAIGAVFVGLERLVKKLKAGRDRLSEARGARIEGRPAQPPLHERFPEAVALAKRLHRASPRPGSVEVCARSAKQLEKASYVMTGKYRK